MKSNETKKLLLDQIHIDGGTQPRVSIDERIVAEYAELYGDGVELPPVTVFFDGATYWLADGFHRYHASRRAGRDCIFADVHKGTQRDAILYSVGANTAHGLRRTNADKRKAVLTMLEDDEWSTWPQTDIAKACGVSREYVCRMASSMSASCDRSHDAVREVTRGGMTYQQDTSNISRTNRRFRAHGPGGISPDAFNPVRQPRPALAQTNLNLPHDPAYGARAIVSAMGADYARDLIDSLTTYLQDQKEGAA